MRKSKRFFAFLLVFTLLLGSLTFNFQVSILARSSEIDDVKTKQTVASEVRTAISLNLVPELLQKDYTETITY